MPWGWLWHLTALTAVDDDVFWLDSRLDLPLLGMCPPSTEQTRRLRPTKKSKLIVKHCKCVHLKLATFCLWPSIMQNPYSSWTTASRSFSAAFSSLLLRGKILMEFFQTDLCCDTREAHVPNRLVFLTLFEEGGGGQKLMLQILYNSGGFLAI